MLNNLDQIKKEEQPILDEEMTSPEVVERPDNFNSKKFILGLAVGILAVFIILVIIFSCLFYNSPLKYPVLEKVAVKFHLPIASINSQFVSYTDFFKDYQTIKYNLDQQLKLEEISANQVPPDLQVRKDAFDQLTKRKLVEQLAEDYGLVISDIEVESSWQQNIVNDFPTEEAAIEATEEFFGMSVAEFKERILKSELLYNKLAEVILFDKEIQKEAQERAEDILIKVKNEEKTFAELAKEYSEDTTTKEAGGYLDWFGRNVMVQRFEDAAFSLEPGDVSEVVKTSYGYHIIKVEGKREASPDGSQPEEVEARHILIRLISLSDYLEKVEQSEGIKKYIHFE